MAIRQRLYRKARFSQVLLDFDGPQVVLLNTSDASLIAGIAINDKQYEMPFFGAEITRQQFNEFLAEEYNLQYLFLRPKFKKWFVFDLVQARNGGEITLHPMQLTPERERYLPGRTLFASDLTEDVAGLEERPVANEKIDVAGAWEINEFNDLYGTFSDIYMFENGVEKFLDQQTAIDEKRRVLDAFAKEWQGGGSYGSFYRTLRGVQEPNERLRTAGITYNSPGFIAISGKPELLQRVRDIIEDFSDRHAEITKAYWKLYRYLQANQLLSLSASKFENGTDLAKNVGEEARDFSLVLSATPWATVLRMARADQLVAAKVLLSLYRRLNKLYEYSVQGRASF